MSDDEGDVRVPGSQRRAADPVELDLMSRAARLFYLQGATRVEIAQQLSLSRFKVARLLDDAVTTGVVTITIRPAGLVDHDLSAELADRFGLRRAVVVRTDGADAVQLHDRLGQLAARLLSEVVTRSDVLGFDNGRTVSHIADHLTSLPGCDVVQLSGLAGSVRETGLDIIRRISEINGGDPYPVYVPMLALDAPSAVALRQQPGVRTTMDRYAEVTRAVVSIGSWDPPVSQVYDRLNEAERRALIEAGAVAETCALMFSADGQPVSGLDDRRIGITSDALRAVPDVIAVGGGAAKTEATRALLASGLVNSLVTDEGTARALLDQRSV